MTAAVDVQPSNKRFDTFVMTGDVILETTPTPKLKTQDSSLVDRQLEPTPVVGDDTASTGGQRTNEQTTAEGVCRNEAEVCKETGAGVANGGVVDDVVVRQLASRLYNLDGYRRSNVINHINSTSALSIQTGQLYLEHYDFSDMSLDDALRQLLERCALSGETQQRERVLVHFSQRYVTCNPSSFSSHDACHTLTCALMLLNTDLHGQRNVGKKMSCAEFITNLTGLNDGTDFPRDVLKRLYNSIRDDPLKWALDNDAEDVATEVSKAEQIQQLTDNPFLSLPDPNTTEEIMNGTLKRKCIVEPGGKKTSFGNRGWKTYYASLRELVLYLYKSAKSAEKDKSATPSAVVRIHHSLSSRATDYRRRPNVIRLTTADGAQCLLQIKDGEGVQKWMDAFNLTAASLSAPPLPGAVGSQLRFTRPVMPSSRTSRSLTEQLVEHEQRAAQLQRDLDLHKVVDKQTLRVSHARSDYQAKLQYLEEEVQRYRTYVLILRTRLDSGLSVNGCTSKPTSPSLVPPDRLTSACEADDIDTTASVPHHCLDDKINDSPQASEDRTNSNSYITQL